MTACTNCGTRNTEGHTFCVTCGARLPAPAIFGSTSPFRVYGDARELTVPLTPSFRFVHEPVGHATGIQFVGRRNEIESLAERILFSEGGSFLVTGYRGVGKTSFVNQVIRKLHEVTPWAESLLGETRVVDIYLNIARPVAPSEMMHHIIRRAHDRLVELGIYQFLDAGLQQALALAYDRTSVNMARKLGESTERSAGVNEASLGGDWMKAVLKVSAAYKQTRSTNVEMSFLGYDDKAAEHDVISISRRLTAGYVKPSTRWQRFWRRNRGEAARVRLKIIFVFDELDKLEEFSAKTDGNGASARPVIDEIIGSLKNLFTTSGLTFVFVAGKDLHERWLEDVGRGDSVYESVFAYDKYLPCLWEDVGTICDSLVDRSSGMHAYHHQAFEAFKHYLTYRGRGIPRRIIRNFNEYVEWDGDRPVLRFTAKDVRRIRLFAGLQALLDRHDATLFGDAHEEVSGTLTDKRRLGVYYLIDWILRQGTLEFTLKDVIAASRRLSVKIALAEEIAPRVAEEIVNVLLDGEYIQLVRRAVTQVVVGVADAEEERRYRVVPRRLVELGGAEVAADVEAVLGPPSLDTPAQRGRMPSSLQRFRILRTIGQGGMGTVYEALDERNGGRVAVKVLADHPDPDGSLAGRFEREAKILRALDHPNIVRLIEAGRDAGRSYIAMEFLDGVALDDVIRRCGGVEVEVAGAILTPVVNALQYVHDQGFVRNDVKPQNIMLTTSGRVCVLDFGISRPTNVASVDTTWRTQSLVIIGTPQFMAPEQFTNKLADERSDVYAVGVMLYGMLVGKYPFDADNMLGLMRAHVETMPQPPSRIAPMPEAVDAVVMRCLAKDPAGRFQRMEDVAVAVREALGSRADRTVDLARLVSEVRVVAREVDALDEMRTMMGPVVPTFAERTQQAVAAAAPRASGARPVAMPPAPIAARRRSTPFPQAQPNMATAEITPRPFYRPPDLSDVPRPSLVLLQGDAERVVDKLGASVSVIPLERRTALGRNSGNDVVLRDSSVSRYHALIDVGDGQWFIEDANSISGTFVRGERVFDRRPLVDGDEIQLGDFTFLFAGPRA